MITNMTFVWPKLFAASLALAAIAVLFEAGTSSTLLDWACVGLLAAESVMAHPAAAFGLPAVVVVSVDGRHPGSAGSPRRRRSRRRTGRRPALARVQDEVRHQPIGSPQVAPGRRQDADASELLEIIRAQYAHLGFRGWLRHRYDNLSDLLRLPLVVGKTRHNSPSPPVRLRVVVLEALVPLWSGGVLLLAAPLLLVRSRITRNTYIVGLAGGVSVLVWTIIEFGPPVATTATNDSSYVTLLLLSLVRGGRRPRVAPRGCSPCSSASRSR